MPDTVITLTPALRERLAKPFDEGLAPAKNWDLPTLAGAGALRSDAVPTSCASPAANLGLRRGTPARARLEAAREAPGRRGLAGDAHRPWPGTSAKSARGDGRLARRRHGGLSFVRRAGHGPAGEGSSRWRTPATAWMTLRCTCSMLTSR